MHILKTFTLCGALALGLGAVTTITSCGPSKEEAKAVSGITALADKVEKEAAGYTAEEWEKIYKEYDAIVAEGKDGQGAEWGEEFLKANTRLLEVAAKYIDKGADPSRFAAQPVEATNEVTVDGSADVSADGEAEVGTEVEISVE